MPTDDVLAISSISVDDKKSVNVPSKEVLTEEVRSQIDESRYLTGIKLFLVFLWVVFIALIVC